MIEIVIGEDIAAPSVERGKYIAIEGDEGAGKTTQAELLVDWLKGQGQPAELVREPGGDPFGEALRQVIKNPAYDHGADEELLVFTAARIGMRGRVVRPLLDQGIWVVTDRSELSTFVYQGIAGDLDLKFIELIQKMVGAVCRPDWFFVLDIPLETSVQRLAERGEAADAFEIRGHGYRERVNSGYRKLPLVLRDYGYHIQVLNGDHQANYVQRQITDIVKPWLKA